MPTPYGPTGSVQYCGSHSRLADEKELGRGGGYGESVRADGGGRGALCGAAREAGTQGMQELYYDIELPLCAVLARMETAGAPR